MKSIARCLVSAVLGAASAFGCGDPLIGDQYQGAPALSVEGVLVQQEPGAATVDPDRLRLSLFWVGFDAFDRLTPVIEQDTTVDSSLGSFSMTVFKGPPDEALTFGDLTMGASEVGVALVVLYSDNNESGGLNSDSRTTITDQHDVVLGASATHLVVYAREPVPATAPIARLFGPLEAGFSLFANRDDSRCRFVDTASCLGHGRVERVPFDDRLILTVYSDPNAVEVPNPLLDLQSSGNNSSIYGGR